MKQVWYVHKWHQGAYKGCNRVPGSFDWADKHAANLARKYTALGWVYEITDSLMEPVPEFVEPGEGI